MFSTLIPDGFLSITEFCKDGVFSCPEAAVTCAELLLGLEAGEVC